MEAGVPREDLIIENRSTNSAENILFTHAKLEEAGLDTGRLICVHKPFMERRLYAAMQVYWPEAKAIYTSPQLTLEEYIRNSVAQGLSEKTSSVWTSTPKRAIRSPRTSPPRPGRLSTRWSLWAIPASWWKRDQAVYTLHGTVPIHVPPAAHAAI